MKISALNTQNNNYQNRQNQIFGMRFSPNAVEGIKASDFTAKVREIPKILDVLERLKQRNDNYVLASFELEKVERRDAHPRLNSFVSHFDPLVLLDHYDYGYLIEGGIVADLLTVRRRPNLYCRIENNAGLTLLDCEGPLTFKKILKKLQYLESKAFDQHAKRVEEKHAEAKVKHAEGSAKKARILEENRAKASAKQAKKVKEEQAEASRRDEINKRVTPLLDTNLDDNPIKPLKN